MSEQDLSNAEIKQKLIDLENKYKNSDEARREELKNNYDAFRAKYFKYWSKDEDDNDDEEPQTPIQKPTEGTIKPGGWGAKNDPNTWVVVSMKDHPHLFKVVDDQEQPKNVATEFTKREIAQQYIDYHKQQIVAPPPPPYDCPNGQHWSVQQEKCVPDSEEPPGTVGQFDKYGIKLIYPLMPNGKVFTDPSYKFSEHNTGTRDTYTLTVGTITQFMVYGYYKIWASKDSEEASYKILGGNHSGSGDNEKTRQGRCYAIGPNFDGTPHFAKEYPHHPDTPKFPNKVAFFDSSFTNLGDIRERVIGCAVVTRQVVDPSTKKQGVYFECWIDNDGLVNGKPANNWKPWFYAYDMGDLEGEPYLKNQGVENGGKGLFYLRIDTVTKKSELYGLTAAEIDPNAITPKPKVK